MSMLRSRLLFTATLAAAAAAQAEPAAPSWQQLTAAAPARQLEWAARYEHGEGVKRDLGRAIELYCAAARRGAVEAQYQLGWLYANGRGVTRDDALAAAWFRLAAQQGDAPSRRMLDLLRGVRARPAACVGPAGATALVARALPRLDPGTSPERRQVVEWVYALAPQYQLDPELVLAVIAAESNFQTQATSPKNAMGLMQLIPETAERFGVEDAFDPQQNLRGGMAYLRWLLAFFQGDVQLALAGYNAGENAVERYRGIPPYPETQAYVARITQAYGKTTHPPVAAVVAPSPLVALVASPASR